MRSYAELKGGEDRNIYYRSERYRAKDLLGGGKPQVFIAGKGYSLRDLSMSGLAVQTVANDTVLDIGGTVDIAVGFDDEVLFSGRGEIMRVEPNGRGSKIGIRIVNGYLDIGELVANHRDHLLRKELDEVPVAQQLYVTPEYRRFCSDVVFMLRRYRNVLDRYEAAAENGSARDRARLVNAIEMCTSRFVDEWRALWDEGYEVVKPMLDDRRAVMAAKRFTETVVTPELVPGPIWRRSYEKPLGYPGDFEIMNYVYSGDEEGDSAYARLCHRIGVEVGMCVRTRMEMVAEELSRQLVDDGDPLLVTSLGCGSAPEVAQVLADPDARRPVSFTLIDQDAEALTCAYRKAFPLINEHGRQAEVNCLHLSFAQLLSGAANFADAPLQDVVYCAGLLDYLPMQQAQMIVAGLYSRVKPGGTLVLGNMKADTNNIWALGFVLDWELIYRDEAQMYELAAMTKPSEMDLRLDPTGYNYMLFLKAPA